MNNALYEIASFMVMRESTVWRWSHTRHHSDTIIVGRDPEIPVPRPPDLKSIVLRFFSLGLSALFQTHPPALVRPHVMPMKRPSFPKPNSPKSIARRESTSQSTLTVIGALNLRAQHPSAPLVGLANLFGTWLMPVYSLTQHAGLAENVLDHRLNCRTVYMNPINRYLYWNMNYHVEHHMFPLVPYHALPQPHALVKDDCPTPYPSLFAAWREIIPAILRQVKDPGLSRQTQASRAQNPACDDSVSPPPSQARRGRLDRIAPPPIWAPPMSPLRSW